MTIIASQLKFSPRSTKSRIADALKAILEGMPVFNYVAFDRVKLYTSDFNEDELPAAQFIDVAESMLHERNRVKRTWSISLEVVNKSTENGYITQQDMWNLEYQIARKIWEQPNLGIPGVIHCTYTSNSTDLHLLEPFYLLRMDFDVVYYEHLVSDC
jgi:hypothetical protein